MATLTSIRSESQYDRIDGCESIHRGSCKCNIYQVVSTVIVVRMRRFINCCTLKLQERSFLRPHVRLLVVVSLKSIIPVSHPQSPPIPFIIGPGLLQSAITLLILDYNGFLLTAVTIGMLVECLNRVVRKLHKCMINDVIAPFCSYALFQVDECCL